MGLLDIILNKRLPSGKRQPMKPKHLNKNVMYETLKKLAPKNRDDGK